GGPEIVGADFLQRLGQRALAGFEAGKRLEVHDAHSHLLVHADRHFSCSSVALIWKVSAFRLRLQSYDLPRRAHHSARPAPISPALAVWLNSSSSWVTSRRTLGSLRRTSLSQRNWPMTAGTSSFTHGAALPLISRMLSST